MLNFACHTEQSEASRSNTTIFLLSYMPFSPLYALYG